MAKVAAPAGILETPKDFRLRFRADSRGVELRFQLPIAGRVSARLWRGNGAQWDAFATPPLPEGRYRRLPTGIYLLRVEVRGKKLSATRTAKITVDR